MYNVMKELKLLKEQMSEVKIQERQDKKVKTLEDERDWFRGEALNLNKKVKEYESLIQRMKVTMENL